MKRVTEIACTLGAGAMMLSCGEPSRLAGNSANTGNSVASGRILTPAGQPASGVWVECNPDSLPPWSARQPGWTSLTDSSGRYLCTELPLGRVGIAASDPGTGLSRWRQDTLVGPKRAGLEPVDTPALPGTLRVALPPGTKGTLYLTGLGLSIAVRGEQEIEVRDVPAGWTGSVRLARSIANTSLVDSGLQVHPGGMDSAGYTRQSLRLRIPLAGGLTSAIAQLPLLVRLDSSFKGFSTSLPDGSDLRLEAANGKALPLTVATWDRSARGGALWSVLDSLKAPGDSMDVVLSWGLPVPAATTSPFTNANGWIAAWPLGDTGTTASDRLGNFAGDAKATVSVPGVAGKASRFDGRLSQILIPGSATGALDLPEGGPYTMSCWARLKDFGTSRFVMGRGEKGSHLKFQRNFGPDTNSWMAKDFRTSPGGGFFTLAKADTATWTHLAMTVVGTKVSLFINGKREAIDSGFDGDAIGRRAALFAIGASTDTLGGTGQHFSGDLAEAWAQSASRSPDWIRLVAANQKPGGPVAKPVK